MKAPQATLADALQRATAYWASKGRSSRMMPLRAQRVIALAHLPLTTPLGGLTPSTGTMILTALGRLSKGSQASYYAAFRRMLTLSGVPTADWPSAGTPPRRVREPIEPAHLDKLTAWLIEKGYLETATLAAVLRGTGMRVEVEALSRTAWTVDPAKGLLRVTGKGGHERVIPVAETALWSLWRKDRVALMQAVPYDTHHSRWAKGCEALGIPERQRALHAVRHLYATQAYERSGRDLHVVRELLGHADINTTARYIGVDMERMRHAAGA